MSIETSVMMRKKLLDALLLKGSINGQQQLLTFLSDIWDLDHMPSTDYRFTNARGDIWQHMENNSDWSEEFLYKQYLDVTNDQRTFFGFLERIVHPLVRSENEVKEYVSLINSYLSRDGYSLQITEYQSGYPIYRVTSPNGVVNPVKNLIFAANGAKPEIVLKDSLSNDIQIVANEQNCLVYDQPISSNGLTLKELLDWWKNQTANSANGISLYQRLKLSLDSPPEQLFFRAYYEIFAPLLGDALPALIPQVYLHYDPYTLRSLGGKKRIPRQRMDFLLLLPNNQRVVIEIDGKQHYADEAGQASPKLYTEMVAADRDLKLSGYDVFRFGGHELYPDEEVKDVVDNFFRKLFVKYGLIKSNNNGQLFD